MTSWPVRLDRINRTGATLVAMVLVAGGAGGLVRSFGLGGADGSEEPVLGGDLRRSVVDNAGLVGGAAVFVGLVLAWMGWRWLRLQLLPTPSLRELRLTDDESGRTSVEAGAVTEAVARDVEAGPGVATARVRLLGHQRAPALDVRADVLADADPVGVRRHVDDFVLPRARSGLGRGELPLTVRLRLGEPVSRTLE